MRIISLVEVSIKVGEGATFVKKVRHPKVRIKKSCLRSNFLSSLVSLGSYHDHLWYHFCGEEDMLIRE